MSNTTDPGPCAESYPRTVLRVSETNRGVADAIVTLAGAPPPNAPVPAPVRLELENTDCAFVPRVAVVPLGSTLETVNHDPMLHTVHLYGTVQTNLALPAEGMRASAVLDAPGLVHVLCDVHGWMRAFVRVDAHAYHAITDEEGRFSIPGLPSGIWEFEVWHEVLGQQRVTVSTAEGSAEVDVIYPTDEEGS